MTKFLIFFILISAFSFSESIEIVTFNYPPIMGKSKFSDMGVLPEIVSAAFKESNIEAEFIFLPTQRAINKIKDGDALIMIGLMEYFDDDTKKHLTQFPIMTTNFDIFYMKDRFPMGFKFESLNDLKPYTIGVLLNGATFSYGKSIGLNVDGVSSLDLIFKKIDAGRNDIGIAIDLAGTSEIERLFPTTYDNWSYISDNHFLSIIGSAIMNQNHPDYKIYEPKFRTGYQKIIKNGKWLEILKKYYGKNPVPKSSIKLTEDFLKNSKAGN